MIRITGGGEGGGQSFAAAVTPGPLTVIRHAGKQILNSPSGYEHL